MKRINTTKLMALLASLCLITSSFVGSTLAKYTTSADANDVARVAKFGVTVTASGSLFSTTYIDAPATGDAVTVASSDSAKLVAPGTKNEEGITFKVTGTPEVDVSIDIDVLDNTLTAGTSPLDIKLAAKTGLPDMTTGKEDDTFDNASVYNPVKFTLVKKGTGSQTTLVNAGTLAAVKTALEAQSQTKVDANTAINDTYVLTWVWDFDDSSAGTYDKQDTLLGDLAAGTTLTPATSLADGTDYELDTNVGIKISVTQIN